MVGVLAGLIDICEAVEGGVTDLPTAAKLASETQTLSLKGKDG